MTALFSVKRSLTKNCSNVTKVNAYTGYVVSIATYASQTWLPNRARTQKLERVQKVATRWFLGSEKSYCDRLKIPNLVRLSLYIDMHDILMLLAILNDNYDVLLERMTRDAYDVNRQFQRGELPIAETRLLEKNENYFMRTKELYKCLIRACPAFHQRPKNTILTSIYRDFFKRMYNETKKCTWRLLRICGNCNIYDKLRQK